MVFLKIIFQYDICVFRFITRVSLDGFFPLTVGTSNIGYLLPGYPISRMKGILDISCRLLLSLGNVWL